MNVRAFERRSSHRSHESTDRAAMDDLRRTFTGTVVLPEDPAYSAARRIWNGSVDRYPAAIARCTNVADIQAALLFARRTGVPVAVRGGGHSFPGSSVCDDGIVIDLGSMDRVAVDPDTRAVRAGGGTLLGGLDRATQAHGLAVPVGAVSHTGVAGLTLGGGIGWLMRKHGLTIDQLRSVELVTAAGERVRADATSHSDLFWGVRGGGGNLGIVTEFKYRGHPVGPSVLAGMIAWPLERGLAMARLYRDWAGESPDELMSALVFRNAPVIDSVPVEMRGQPIVAVLVCWIGDDERGAGLLRPMRSFGPPTLDTVESRAFVEFQSSLDASYPHGLHAYVKAADIAGLDDDVIDLSVAYTRRTESPRSGVIFWQLGGAVSRVAPDATAFGSRSSGFIVNITGATDTADGFDGERRWAREFHAALEPYGRGVYVNFLMDEGDARIREAYGAQRYARLARLKHAYDPENVLRLNQNVPPAGPDPSGRA